MPKTRTFFLEHSVVQLGVDNIVHVAMIDHGFADEHVMLVRCGLSAALQLCVGLTAALIEGGHGSLLDAMLNGTDDDADGA